MNEGLEEGTRMTLDFHKIDATEGVVPVVVQDADSARVLLVAYADQAALSEALKRRIAVFRSTSRDELWIKGATSGDYLELVEVRVNCEQNSLLYLVRLKGSGACHTKGSDGKSRKSCFYRRISGGAIQFVAD